MLERAELEPGLDLLDVGTGSGGNIAIPAALRGAGVVGADITPEHFEHARRRAREAGVEVRWVEADAQALPFADASFDRVISTFGAMFAPDHARAASELVRVCRPGGRIVMTTWLDDGFVGEMFQLSGAFVPPAAGAQPPALWGVESHAREMFAGAGADVEVARARVEFEFASVQDAVERYVQQFGPFVAARRALEPQGRWQGFVEAFAELVRRFDAAGAGGGGAVLPSDYLLISAER